MTYHCRVPRRPIKRRLLYHVEERLPCSVEPPELPIVDLIVLNFIPKEIISATRRKENTRTYQ